MKLKNKLISNSLLIVILVMVVTTAAVSLVINRQNVSASHDRIKNSLNIIREDLEVKEKGLLSDARQAISLDGMAGKVKFIYNYKKEKDSTVTRNTFREMASSLFNVAGTSGLWEMGIYDKDGDLDAFVVEVAEETYSFGYPTERRRQRAGRYHKKGRRVKAGIVARSYVPAENESEIEI